MNTEMTFVGLNRRIAELKGLSHYPSPYSDSELRVYPPNEDTLSGTDKDWSKNLAHAWQLFEELPKPSSIQNFGDAWIVTMPIHPPLTCDVASTACEAICLAWIKWKELS